HGWRFDNVGRRVRPALALIGGAELAEACFDGRTRRLSVRQLSAYIRHLLEKQWRSASSRRGEQPRLSAKLLNCPFSVFYLRLKLANSLLEPYGDLLSGLQAQFELIGHVAVGHCVGDLHCQMRIRRLEGDINHSRILLDGHAQTAKEVV